MRKCRPLVVLEGSATITVTKTDISVRLHLYKLYAQLQEL